MIDWTKKIEEISNDKWLKGFKEINEKINEKMSSLLGYLPIGSGYPFLNAFLKHVVYVVLEFLNKNNETDAPEELHIRIPVEELTMNKNKQAEFYSIFQGAVAACLTISTIDKFYENIRLPQNVGYRSNDESRDENWYREDDSFYSPKDKEIWRTIGSFLFKENKNSGEEYVRVTMTSTLFDEYYRDGNFFRLKNREDLSAEQGGIEKVLQIRTSGNGKYKQYNSAAFVTPAKCYMPLNDKLRSINSDTFTRENPVKYIVKDIQDLYDKNIYKVDIIVASGDKSLGGDINYFRDFKPKKIIYISTNISDNNVMVYPFSIREMNYYCSPQQGEQYPKFEIPLIKKDIEFPWYNEKKKELEVLLDASALVPQEKKEIINRFRFIVFRLDFSNEILNSGKDYFLNSFHGGERIKQWIENLEYNEDSNPKMKIVEDLIKDNPDNTIVCINRVDPHYKRDKINKLEEGKNIIVIDAASYKEDNEKPRYGAYRHIMKTCFFPQIIGLYYKEENYLHNMLMKHIYDELRVENSEIREKYETNIDYEYRNGNSEISKKDETNTNDDYRDGNSEIIKKDETNYDEEILIDIDDLYKEEDPDETFIKNIESIQVRCSVKFEDGTKCELTGDVLEITDNGYKCKKIVSYLESNSRKLKIKYYDSENFDKLIETYWSIDINHYSGLWKERLERYISTKSDESKISRDSVIESIGKEVRIDNFGKYCNRYPSKFPDCIRKICDFLKKKNYLTEDEENKILTARYCNNRNASVGRRIKGEIFDYIQSDICGSELKKISKKSRLKINDIIKETIKEGIIEDITIKGGDDND